MRFGKATGRHRVQRTLQDDGVLQRLDLGDATQDIRMNCMKSLLYAVPPGSVALTLTRVATFVAQGGPDTMTSWTSKCGLGISRKLRSHHRRSAAAVCRSPERACSP